MNKGFTIVEVAISIFIILIAVIGVYSAFAVMVILASDNSNKFMASYLAQEGMEIVRNIRDSNWVSGSNWQSGFSDCFVPQSCQVDYVTGTGIVENDVRPWVGEGLYLNIDNGGFYSYATGSESRFKRKIIIESMPDNSMRVSVEVTWQKNATFLNPQEESAGTCGKLNCIKMQESMYDWF